MKVLWYAIVAGIVECDKTFIYSTYDISERAYTNLNILHIWSIYISNGWKFSAGPELNNKNLIWCD